MKFLIRGGGGGGDSMAMTPTFQSFRVHLGTIIFATRKSGGAEPSMMLDP